jgi:LDH2 family malate/lactate/ureidoglycolate dehydrogenase
MSSELPANAVRRILRDDLARWIEAILHHHGVPEDHSRIVADCLSAADVKGVFSHGVSRLPIYLRRLKHKLIDPTATPLTVTETDSTLLLDARSGFGHPAACFGVKRGIAKAAKTGICAVGISNSTHFGMAGYYADIAGREGFIGLVTSNSAARMAPWGAKDALMGTNPLAIGIPADHEPIVLDMSTSAAAFGKIMLARETGQPIPPGWALDPAGTPTTNAVAALAGTLLPLAGPKGSGLAFMLDILAGVLTRAKFGRDVNSIYNQFERPEECGHFTVLIDVSAFIPLKEFKERVTAYVADFKKMRPIEEGTEVLLPGEIESRKKQQARSNGILFDEATLSQLHRLANEAGIVLPTRAQ